MSANALFNSIPRSAGAQVTATNGTKKRHLGSTIRATAEFESDFILDSTARETPPVSFPQVETAKLVFIDRPTKFLREQLRNAFPPSSFRVHLIPPAEFASDVVSHRSADVVILALDLPDGASQRIYHQIRRVNEHISVIFLADTIRPCAIIEALKNGAFDCLCKPVDWAALRRVVSEAVRISHDMGSNPIAIPDESDDDFSDDVVSFVGSCSAMREVYKDIGRVAAHSMPVLITGETGTGKDVVARSLNQHGSRPTGKFLALNCAAVPESLLESELFGHEKGAFTGADQRRIGKFEQCDGGTLFLDEIGDMPLALQAKLLRVLQDQTFERVGGNETVKTDVRLIAATHRDLKAWSDQGRFRSDLYYRLSVFTIHLPPLRERGDDLEMLVRRFVRRFRHELGRKVYEVSEESMDRLRAHSWPGNVRELQSVLKQALLQASGKVLLPSFLPRLVNENSQPASTACCDARPLNIDALINERLSPTCSDLYAALHRELDRTLLAHVLDYVHGNQHQAARLLGIARQTLRLKMREVGVHVKQSIATNGLPNMARSQSK